MAISENRTILKDANGAQLIIAERTTWQCTATLLDQAGAPVPSANVSALTLTLYNRDSATQEIINSVSAVNILNAGRGTLHATSGLLTLVFEPADNAIVDATQDLEWHRALIEGTYSGTKAIKYEIDFQVRNLSKVGT